MNKPDPGTPIFGELNNELGGLPDIDVHEFDSHAFDFGGGTAESSEQDSGSSASSGGTAQQTTRSGGRRRKED